jgi:hypothetical protein
MSSCLLAASCASHAGRQPLFAMEGFAPAPTAGLFPG